MRGLADVGDVVWVVSVQDLFPLNRRDWTSPIVSTVGRGPPLRVEETLARHLLSMDRNGGSASIASPPLDLDCDVLGFPCPDSP